jgi:hypothetical protein
MRAFYFLPQGFLTLARQTSDVVANVTPYNLVSQLFGFTGRPRQSTRASSFQRSRCSLGIEVDLVQGT